MASQFNLYLRWFSSLHHYLHCIHKRCCGVVSVVTVFRSGGRKFETPHATAPLKSWPRNFKTDFFRPKTRMNTCRYELHSNGSLTVNQVDAVDAGVYRCAGKPAQNSPSSSGKEIPDQIFASQLHIACKCFIQPYLIFKRELLDLPENRALCYHRIFTCVFALSF